MSPIDPQPAGQAGDLSTSPRFVSMTATIAQQLLRVHNIEDLERAVQLYAVIENGVFDYMSQESAKLSEQTLAAYKAWISSGKKKLTRT